MKGYINNIDWYNIEAMKYWSFPANTSKEMQRDTIRNLIFSNEYIGSLKVDGYYQRLLKDEDGNCYMIARSRNTKGEVVNKIDWVPQLYQWMQKLPNGTCFLSEAYLPNNEGSKNVTTILGCLKEKAIERQKTTPLHFHIFDCMAYNNQNYNNTPYKIRIQKIQEIKKVLSDPMIHFTEFFQGQKLWEQLQRYLANGREGMVIMNQDAIVYNKRTPARVSIKVKKELEQTIDCFFTGRTGAPTRLYTGKEIENWQYWEDIKTREKINDKLYRDYMNGRAIEPVTKGYFNNWAGSLEIGVFKGEEIIPIGYLSGLSDEIKANVQEYAMKPIEVTAMELDNESGALRHGKMKQFRPDLRLEDCTWEKIFK